MSSSLNLVQLIGHVGKEPEALKSGKNGSFVRVSLSTTKTYTSETGERKEVVDWHTVYFNNRLGNVVKEHLNKGSYIYVAGELRTTVWQDKENQKRYNTAVYASELKFLDKKPMNKSSSKELSPEQESIPDEAELNAYEEYAEANN